MPGRYSAASCPQDVQPFDLPRALTTGMPLRCYPDYDCAIAGEPGEGLRSRRSTRERVPEATQWRSDNAGHFTV